MCKETRTRRIPWRVLDISIRVIRSRQRLAIRARVYFFLLQCFCLFGFLNEFVFFPRCTFVSLAVQYDRISKCIEEHSAIISRFSICHALYIMAHNTSLETVNIRGPLARITASKSTEPWDTTWRVTFIYQYYCNFRNNWQFMLSLHQLSTPGTFIFMDDDVRPSRW